MTQTVNVVSCFARQDKLWTVAFKDARGTGYAVSDRKVPQGTDVRIRDGRVIG